MNILQRFNNEVYPISFENITLKYQQKEYELLQKIKELKSKNNILKKSHDKLSIQIQLQTNGGSQIKERSISETRKTSKSKSKTSKSKIKKIKKT